MTLSNHVTLTISQDSVGVSRAGFGVPLIVSHSAGFAERIRFYNSLADVAVDFPVTTSPEYLAASALFSQSPHPDRIAIGRAANVPTQNYFITVAAVRNNHTYSITVKGEGVTPETVTFTSDGTATANEIATGLRDALNAVVGKNFTAALATDDINVTGDAAGDWFSLEVNPDDLTIEQDHADPGVAADLAAIQLENDDWYCVLTHFNSNAYVLAVDAWVAAQKKIYLFDVNETDAITTAAGNSDTLDDVATLNRPRTAGTYHPSPADFNSAAWAGRVLPLDPGSATWKFKTLTGVAAVNLTATHRTNLVARNANFFETVAGLDIMSEGTTADGDFIDVQRSLDWLEDDLTKSVFETLAGANKIPYTDRGVAVIEAAVRASLRRAVNRGVLAEDPEPAVTVPAVADVSTADKTARILRDVKFTGTLEGATHKVIVTGAVSV